MKKANKRKNYRCCISCRKIKEKNYFIRIVRSFPDGHILLKTGIGRSAYICPYKECVLVAQTQKRLSKALKTKIPNSVYEKILQELFDTLTVENDQRLLQCKLEE